MSKLACLDINADTVEGKKSPYVLVKSVTDIGIDAELSEASIVNTCMMNFSTIQICGRSPTYLQKVSVYSLNNSIYIS